MGTERSSPGGLPPYRLEVGQVEMVEKVVGMMLDIRVGGLCVSSYIWPLDRGNQESVSSS